MTHIRNKEVKAQRPLEEFLAYVHILGEWESQNSTF